MQEKIMDILQYLKNDNDFVLDVKGGENGSSFEIITRLTEGFDMRTFFVFEVSGDVLRVEFRHLY